jgi:hypothetical protein
MDSAWGRFRSRARAWLPILGGCGLALSAHAGSLAGAQMDPYLFGAPTMDGTLVLAPGSWPVGDALWDSATGDFDGNGTADLVLSR